MSAKDYGLQIVVLTNGFVYVGQASIEGDWITIENARNIRVWGTTKGLGELRNGPTGKTVLDECGIVQAPKHALVNFLKCNVEKWGK